MANTLSEALLVLTSWNTASDDLTSQPTRTLVKDFCENTLKSDEASKFYCTVLDVKVSENQKKDAESVGVTLIPAVRDKWSDPEVDPPVPNWLLHHYTYYPGLKELLHIKHVVSFSPKTKNAAAAIQERLFPQAHLHQLSVPTPPGVVIAFDAWSKHACGLTGYHRAIIQDFIARKAESGEYLKAYSTVVDVKLSADQIEDAEKCGVTLIKAQNITEGVDEIPNISWLKYHYNHFPDLQKLQNIKYVVGYAPKTGWAAIDIRNKLFPAAKLVLINHACEENNCLLVRNKNSNLEQEMVKMAGQADILFSIGPHIHGIFQRAYRAVTKLSKIPHRAILPKLRQEYFDNEMVPASEMGISGHSLLTYGQLNTEDALKRCDSIAASIGSVANKHKEFGKKSLQWKIHGVSEQAYEKTETFLVKELKSSNVLLKSYKHHSAETLLQSVRQSDLCLPPSCYTDYSFEGLEAMAAGLPTTVQDDSHIAAMIDKHFEDHKDYCVVGNEADKLTSKINKNLIHQNVAYKKAQLLKEDLDKSEAVTKGLAKFASLLTDQDFETTETTALQSGMSVMQDMETAESTAPQLGISDTENVETTQYTSTELQPGIPVREGIVTRDTTESTAVQSGMPVIQGADPTIPTTVQDEAMKIEKETDKSHDFTHGLITGDGNYDRTSQSLTVPWHGDHRKTEDKNSDVNNTQLKMLNKGGRTVGKKKSSEFETSGQKVGEAVKHKMHQVIEGVDDNSRTPSRPTKTAKIDGSTDFAVCVGLDEESYQQQMRDLDSQVQTISVREKNEQLKAALEKIKAELDKNETDAIANNTSLQRVDQNCKDNFGEGTMTKSTKRDSLAISLDLPTLYNLYRLEQTCLSGSFPDSFEPLLITDKMREEADKVGLQLKLKATYDQARFDELELFFINRDGGGLKPVKVFVDDIKGKDAEEIHIRKSDGVAEGVADRTPTEHRQSLEDIPSTSEMERTTLESQLKEAKEEKATLKERCKELTQKLESTEQSLVSQRIETRVEREKLQSELEDKKKLINEFEDIVSELEHKSEQSEQRKSEEKGDGSELKPVKVFDDVIEGKDAEEIHLDDEDTDQKSDTMITGTVDSTAIEDIQSSPEMERATVESQLKEAKEETAILVEGCKELTQKLVSSEQSLVSQHIGKSRGREKLQSELEEEKKLVKKLDNTVEEFKHNLEHSSQKKQAEKAPTFMPQRPPQHHHEMSAGHMMQASAATGPPTSPVVYSQAQQMPYQTAQSHTQGTTKDQVQPKMYRSSPQGHLTSPHHQGKNPIPQEIQTKATQVYGDWSVTLVNGQHQGQGQKFKLPCGLAFHRDKLVVCDYGNNIVQILNKDYTCDKVLGSFDGQFAKPFRPWSVAISRFNHYFILDRENKQIVVCDENGKIIKIITLPENIKVVWDIALMDDFVLVILSLTSRDITRPEDRDDRLVKYTQSGEYVKDAGGQTSFQTKFYRPHSVAVNSKNVIMVYDWGNDCIKCFDSNLNFLHQFGQSQLQTPRTKSGTEGYGYIAVDEDDNVYVCDYVRVRSTGDVIREWIVKYGCDGKFICDLFKGHVSLPLRIAVMGDKIGVVERKSDQIKVFSK